jgi:hypothetical protein
MQCNKAQVTRGSVPLLINSLFSLQLNSCFFVIVFFCSASLENDLIALYYDLIMRQKNARNRSKTLESVWQIKE